MLISFISACGALNIWESEEDLSVVMVSNGVTPSINNVHMVEGANIKVAPKEMGFEVGEFIVVA